MINIAGLQPARQRYAPCVHLLFNTSRLSPFLVGFAAMEKRTEI